MSTPLKIILAILVISFVGIYSYLGWGYFTGNNLAGKKSAACTMDAKICPDGSSVGRVGPNCEFAQCPVAATKTDQVADWNSFVNQGAKFTFKYPQGMWALTVGSNETAIKPDEEYVVSTIGKSLFYLSIFLYKSDKDPSAWWNTEGKNKFEILATVIGEEEDPKVKINLTFDEKPTTFSGQNALNVIISSDYESPNTPKKRYVTLVQHSGFIILTSYKDLETPTSSIDLSKKILSTFVFSNEVPSPTPSMRP